jgi:hypothetical protein
MDNDSTIANKQTILQILQRRISHEKGMRASYQKSQLPKITVLGRKQVGV